MKIEKVVKIKWMVLSISVLLFAIFGIIFMFINNISVPREFKLSSKIDAVIFSDNKFSDSKLPKNKTKNMFIPKTGINQNKNFKFLYQTIQNYTLYPFNGSEKTKISSDSKFTGIKRFENLSFELNRLVNEDAVVQMKYNFAQKKLDIILPSFQMKIDGKNYITKDIVLYTIDNITSDSIIKFSEDIFQKISDALSLKVAIGSIKNQEVKIYMPKGKNLLSSAEASFENGMWQTEVGDCSNELSGEPDLRLSASADASNGKISANLFSTNHFACISKTFPVQMKSDSIYQFMFDYKNLAGNDIQYYFKLRSGNLTKQEGYANSELIPAKNHGWNTYSTIINPETITKNFITPEYSNIQASRGTSLENLGNEGISDLILGDPIKEIKYLDIFFYAPSDGTKEISNLYDNVQLNEYELSETRKIDINSVVGKDLPLAENISLQSDENTFEYIVDHKNLLDPEIASFENGLWQKEPGDCTDSNPGEPDLNLEKSSDASNGKFAIKLSSKNHFACSSKTFPVFLTSGKLYKLQFDYKNIEGGKAMYYYNFRSDENQNAHQETIETKDNDWHTYETIIDPGISNVKNVDIFFYAPSDGTKEVTTLYDNVRLVEWLPKDIDLYYLSAEQKVDETPKLNSVEWKPINIWKNRVILHGVKAAFLLSYPEKYSEKWKVYPVVLQANKKNMIVPDNYAVPEIESNRQATKEELTGFLTSRLISATGTKFLSKNFDRSIRNDNLNNGWFCESWFKDSIPEEMHYQVNNYGNLWWVDPTEICKKPGVCQKNDDESYDISLIVEHSAFKYLSLMLLISGTTLFGCIGYLVFASARRRKGKKLVKSKKRQQMFSHRRVRREEADIKNK